VFCITSLTLGGRLRCEGQSKCSPQTAQRGSGEVEFSAMEFGKFAGDRQAESKSGRTFVNPLTRPQNLRDLIRPQARTARHVAAIDLDPAMLAIARDRAFAEGLTNCTFTVGDAYDLQKLVPLRVDWVLITNTFNGVPDTTRLTRAVAAVLKPGGVSP
jgi:SAM-dependent methyltransferase